MTDRKIRGTRRARPGGPHLCGPGWVWYEHDPARTGFPGSPPSGYYWRSPHDVPVGTVVECDCGETWVCVREPGYEGRDVVVMPRNEWRQETRWERKRRERRARRERRERRHGGNRDDRDDRERADVTEYVILALLGVADGRTEEAHREAADLDEALTLIREVVEKRGRNWHAITLVHVEDYPKALDNAERQSQDGGD